MNERAYTTIDKTAWGDGPWQDEPDKVQWRDEATGLPCLAVRQPRLGHWCGYVGVSEGHPAFEDREAGYGPIAGETYRTLAYVRSQCAKLASQLAQAVAA